MEREEEIPGQGSFSFSRQRRRLFAILSISLSGLLGTFAFRYQDIFTPLIPIPSSFLFPLLTGLFGAPIIAQSIRNKPQIPKQDKIEITMKKSIFKNSFIGSLSGSLVSWLPGVSSGVATVLARYFVRGESEEFIISLSSVNTSNALYNLLFFYLLGISRSGAINGVKSLLGFISLDWFLIFLAVADLISLFSYIALLHLSPSLSLIFTRLNYTTLNISILIFLFGMILLFTGINGILLFLLSFFVGSILQKLGVKRTNAMSCIMIPIILMRFNII
jgi:putative membrane protein